MRKRLKKTFFSFIILLVIQMEFDTVLRKRRSIRKFQSKEISMEAVRQIITAGTLAPSAHFREPWEVLVLRKEKEKVIQCMLDYVKIHPEDESISKTAEVIGRADLLFLVYCTSMEQYDYHLLSIGGMIENMELVVF